jgi:hypothetical protein
MKKNTATYQRLWYGTFNNIRNAKRKLCIEGTDLRLWQEQSEVHKMNINLLMYPTADLESAGDYFFLAGKTHNGTVQGIFRGGRDLFDP